MIPAPRLIPDTCARDRVARLTDTAHRTAVLTRAQGAFRRRAVRTAWLTAVAWFNRDVSDELPF